MENPESDAAPAVAAAGLVAAAVEAAHEGDDRRGVADAGGAGAAARGEPEAEEEEGGLDVGVIDGPLARADLSQDAITDLRARHKQLKAEQKRVRQEMKNKARKRQRVLARMRHIDTASVMQVLLERGVNLGAPAAAGARPAAAPRGAEPAGEGA